MDIGMIGVFMSEFLIDFLCGCQNSIFISLARLAIVSFNTGQTVHTETVYDVVHLHKKITWHQGDYKRIGKQYFWPTMWIWILLFVGRKYSIQDYLYSAFHDTIIAKQLYRKLRFYNRFIYCRNFIYLINDKIVLILYIFWGVGIKIPNRSQRLLEESLL